MISGWRILFVIVRAHFVESRMKGFAPSSSRPSPPPLRGGGEGSDNSLCPSGVLAQMGAEPRRRRSQGRMVVILRCPHCCPVAPHSRQVQIRISKPGYSFAPTKVARVLDR